VRAAIDLAGGLDSIISNGMSVAIKPNLVCTDNYADNETVSLEANGMITDYRVIQAVVNVVRELNPAGQVYIIEGSAIGTTIDNMETMGWDNVTGVSNFIGIEESSGDWYDYGSVLLQPVELSNDVALYPDSQKPNNARVIFLNKIYYDADVLISIPVLKNHFVTGVTGAVKNVGIGATPGKIYGNGPSDADPTNRWNGIDHDNINNLHRWIHDFYACRPVDFVVMDGLQGNDNGPVAMNYSNFSSAQKNSRMILAGKDAIAVDAIASLLMAHDPQEVNHLVHLHNSGFGIVNPALIDVVGESVEEERMDFSIFSTGLGSKFDDFEAADYNPDYIRYNQNTIQMAFSNPADLARLQFIIDEDTIDGYRIDNFDNIELDISTVLLTDSILTINFTDKYLNTLEKQYQGEFINPTVGIINNKNNNDKSISVNYNAVNNFLQLDISNNYYGNYNMKILDLSGRVIQHEIINKNVTSYKSNIPIEKLAIGNYVVLIENGISKYSKLIATY
jgi:uncharacterized protein (DUF362 family)